MVDEPESFDDSDDVQDSFDSDVSSDVMHESFVVVADMHRSFDSDSPADVHESFVVLADALKSFISNVPNVS